MLKLKLQYLGHLMRRADSLEKTLMLRKIEGRRRRGRQRMRWLDGMVHLLSGHGFWWILGIGDGQGGLVCCGSWGHKELDTTERLNNTRQTSAPRPERGTGRYESLGLLEQRLTHRNQHRNLSRVGKSELLLITCWSISV